MFFIFILGVAVGVLTAFISMATVILGENYLNEKERERSRHEAVLGAVRQFGISYEEADKLVHTER